MTNKPDDRERIRLTTALTAWFGLKYPSTPFMSKDHDDPQDWADLATWAWTMFSAKIFVYDEPVPASKLLTSNSELYKFVVARTPMPDWEMKALQDFQVMFAKFKPKYQFSETEGHLILSVLFVNYRYIRFDICVKKQKDIELGFKAKELIYGQ